MNKWIIQETKTKKIVKVIEDTIDIAFGEMRKMGDRGIGYSLTSAPLFENYKGVRYCG